jgi:hypothetical protein
MGFSEILLNRRPSQIDCGRHVADLGGVPPAEEPMMPNPDGEIIARLAEELTHQKHSPVVVGNYCCYTRGFLDYLAR